MTEFEAKDEKQLCNKRSRAVRTPPLLPAARRNKSVVGFQMKKPPHYAECYKTVKPTYGYDHRSVFVICTG